MDARNPASRTAKVLAIAKKLSVSTVVVVSCALSYSNACRSALRGTAVSKQPRAVLTEVGAVRGGPVD